MLAAPSSSIACCARRSVVLHFARYISASNAQHSASTGDGVSLKKPKVTKKKYAELPTARVLSDGTAAAPLGEWNGGLRELNVAYEHVPPSIRAHLPAHVNILLSNTIRSNAVACASGRGVSVSPRTVRQLRKGSRAVAGTRYQPDIDWQTEKEACQGCGFRLRDC